jgi:SAM-dependent methyltransferase
VKIDLLQWICCPQCKNELALTVTRGEAESVTEGILVCPPCAATYPIVRGIPRFVANDGYVETFSYEWNKWNRVQLDPANGRHESEETFTEKTGLTAVDLRGKLVLDVGCGAGRFLEVVSRWGARAIGIDFSFAVEASQANIGDRPNVDVIQADVFHLPFRDAVFDTIFSIGVLHHTRDTREAFLSLPRHLKNGGECAVWLYYYTDHLYNRATDFWRRIVGWWPNAAIYAWSWLLCALFSRLYSRPLMSRRPWGHLRRVLPVNTHPDWHWRVLDTFDWYSPTYQDKDCSPARVIGWCREGGLRGVEILDFPTSIRARRDVEGKLPLIKSLPDFRLKRLVVFGAGAAGRQAFDLLRGLGLAAQVVAVCDNDPAKAGTTFAGLTVTPFSHLPRTAYDHVIIASVPGLGPISAQLVDSGLADRRDFFSLAYIENLRPLLELSSGETASQDAGRLVAEPQRWAA